MDKKLIGLDLSHIAEGGLQEKLDNELEKVFDNILDLNTEAKAKRKITIELIMSSNEERTVVDTTMTVKSKLAPQNGVATTILVGRDFDTGQVHANELKSTVPGQMYFDENGEILTDIGQPVTEIEQQEATKKTEVNGIENISNPELKAQIAAAVHKLSDELGSK